MLVSKARDALARQSSQANGGAYVCMDDAHPTSPALRGHITGGTGSVGKDRLLIMHQSLFLTAIALTVSTLAAPAPSSNHVLHEKREAKLLHWEKRDRVHPDVLLPVRIGLTQSNLDKGPELLDEVSNPASPKYGQHYSMEDVYDIFAPQTETVEAVRTWLQDSGIHVDRISQSTNKQWIQLDSTTAELESLINADYHHYEHYQTGRSNIACDEYSVPAHVQPHIDYITPGLKLLTPSHPKDPEEKAKVRKRTFGVTAPSSGGHKPAKGNELGIFEDLGDVYAQEDLDLFFATLAPNIPIGTHPKLDAIDGATAPNPVTAAGAESDLDFQISYPIIYPQNSILFQTDDPVYEADYEFNGFLNNFLDAIDGSYCTYSAFGETGNSPLDPPYPDPAPGGYKGQLQCGVYTPTNVISISYGGQESDLPASYQQRQCNEYMKLGMAGISIVVASGDSGVGGPMGRCLGPNNNIFSPDFPATCPFLTTVGSTFLPPNGDVTKDAEVATTRFPSGGGFSNVFGRPKYQDAAVAAYLASGVVGVPGYANGSVGQGGGVYNKDGRGYPDVSAVGDNVVIFNKGMPVLIGGTSASAPVFASVLVRVNEERIARGKGRVGFVNPVLYAHPEILNDVTVGNNPNCGSNGFAATKGWDPGSVVATAAEYRSNDTGHASDDAAMDPLSVAASVVGLLTAAGKVSALLSKFVGGSVGAPVLAKTILQEVTDISACLAQLQTFLTGTRIGSRSRTALILVEQVVVTLTDCVLTFSELEDILGSLKVGDPRVIINRLLWVKRESALRALTQRLHSSKTSLNLMLSTLTCESVDQATSAVEHLTELVQQVLRDNQDLVSRLQQAPSISSNVTAPSTLSAHNTVGGNAKDEDDPLTDEDDEDDASTIIPRNRGKLLFKFPRDSELQFEHDLQNSRVYTRTMRRKSRDSLVSSAAISLGWSCLSEISLAGVSQISVISLPVTASELANGQHYHTHGSKPSSIPVTKTSQDLRPIQISLIGALISGKTTVFRQLRQIHGVEMASWERDEARAVLRKNLDTVSRLLCGLLIPLSEHDFQYLDIDHESILEHPELVLPGDLSENSSFFHARSGTTSDEPFDFWYKGRAYQLKDIGNRRPSHKIWLADCVNSDVIMYTVALTGYCYTSWRDTNLNQMDEALAGFQWLTKKTRAPIILLFTKTDVLRRNLPIFPLSHYAESYSHGTNYEKACEYFADRFQQLYTRHFAGANELFIYFVNAVDPNEVKIVFRRIEQEVLSNYHKYTPTPETGRTTLASNHHAIHVEQKIETSEQSYGSSVPLLQRPALHTFGITTDCSAN
ncbi:uncharacterized protein KY384_000795 [Bacidia gigantensis]|uniref:uncharacterized protein n=1 Tax=Bacidia gigantensis TaxID=2732470 RepID=UPI001D03E8E8|nr:uncharacterized protein KY384_000795 [Bacidia gigantensis]KAG8526033.1 hypothetical protein KY384_000795 [Bacidia gigantensis]